MRANMKDKMRDELKSMKGDRPRLRRPCKTKEMVIEKWDSKDEGNM